MSKPAVTTIIEENILMKLSKKRAKMLRTAVSDACYDMLSNDEFFDQEEIASSPETWYPETTKLFSLLSEIEARIESKIFKDVFNN